MVDPTQTEFKHVEKSVTEGGRIRFLKDFQAKRGRAEHEDKAFIQRIGCISKPLMILKMKL
jgi:hypothetical protein